MFTGIIKGIGKVQTYDQDSLVLCIVCPLFKERRPSLGDSIAIDGVCLTVSYLSDAAPEVIGFDLGHETRELTLLARLKPETLVNVEFALAMGDPLDGHMVQGHVDGISELLAIVETKNGCTMRFRCKPSLLPLIVPKGSVAINGVSLTVNDVKDDWFSVCLIPHTVEHTSFKKSTIGDLMHVETDVIGRYLYHFHQRLERTPSIT